MRRGAWGHLNSVPGAFYQQVDLSQWYSVHDKTQYGATMTEDELYQTGKYSPLKRSHLGCYIWLYHSDERGSLRHSVPVNCFGNGKVALSHAFFDFTGTSFLVKVACTHIS